MLLLPARVKPKLLDLFCGAGGAARGYQLAGFHVTGVDIKPQPRYAGDRFVQGDALEYLIDHWREYDTIHASPPCQGYSEMKHFTTQVYPKLIAITRALLQLTGKPYVIENVRGAAAELNAPIILCGHAFGLKTYRHRYFEVQPWILAPAHIKHNDNSPQSGKGVSSKGFVSVVGSGGKRIPKQLLADHGFTTETEYLRYAMGIDWMNREELAESIPPAYSEYIGRHLFKVA